MPIDAIRPEIFREEEQIEAFVTLRNPDLLEGDRNIPGLNLGFNTQDNSETIVQNREILMRAFGLDSNWTCFAEQVHSNRVKNVTKGGTFAGTDGLVTQIPGLALIIQIADCPAILIADTSSKTVAAIHAGWRGAAGDIVPQAVERMEQAGATMDRCKAFISPSICVEHFEVGREVADQFPGPFVDTDHYRKPHVNLKEFLCHQLVEGGITRGNIEIHPGCTVENEQYYSYRREDEESGRMVAVIRLKDG